MFISQNIKRFLKPKIEYLLDVIVTEYNFRFRKYQTQQELKLIRNLPRNLHIEGTNICNAKCTFCAYPEMERFKRNNAYGRVSTNS